MVNFRKYICILVSLISTKFVYGSESSSRENDPREEGIDSESESELYSDTEEISEEFEKKYFDLYKKEKHRTLSSEKQWFSLLLKEPGNVSFFVQEKEITRHIVNGVISGKLTPYKDENCKEKMSVKDFLIALRDPKVTNYDDSSDFQVKSSNNNLSEDTVPSENERYLPRDISVIKIMADVLIDKIYSDWFLLINSMGIAVPADEDDPKSVTKNIAYFDFKELYYFFKSLDSNVSWIDPRNNMGNKKFSNIFLYQQHIWLLSAYRTDRESSRIRGIDYNEGLLDLRKRDLYNTESVIYLK